MKNKLKDLFNYHKRWKQQKYFDMLMEKAESDK